MELLLNELSLEAQFADLSEFRTALDRVMRIRNVARTFGRQVHCHRSLPTMQVTRSLTVQQAIRSLERSQQQAVMQWITRDGPFWDDQPERDPDEYLVCYDSTTTERFITDSALGEAAYRRLGKSEHRTVSFAPSTWEFTPIQVFWMSDHGPTRTLDVPNYWALDELSDALRSLPFPLTSWEQLAAECPRRCPSLRFLPDCFQQLRSQSFYRSAAVRILELLHILEKFKGCFGAKGQRTPEGQTIYQEHFTGAKAWFSDSSETEKRDFEDELTFRHPDSDGEVLVCTWHGKVRCCPIPIRLHFSWPVRVDDPLYVAYIGPKITKR